MKKHLLILTLATFTFTVQAACPTWPSAARFEQHGDEVIDMRTGLVWQRCSAGQSWSGSTCAGTASTYSHTEALGLAGQANPSNNPAGWRLPSVKELASLADLGCEKPAIDATVFPATPSSDNWSSTPNVSRSNVAWTVAFSQGHIAANRGIANQLTVRLVRSAF